MIKFLIITLFLLTTLQSRENPFFPSDGEEDIEYVNKQKKYPPLQRATISLPTQARVLQSVSITYKNLDGSIESKSIDLDNSIDWHLPLFISQSYTSTDSAQDIENKEKKPTFEKVGAVKFATFLANGKHMRIVTKDKMIRNFLLVKPHRIVLDFKRDSSLKNYKKIVPESIFTKIRVGNHLGYYRVVLELDGHYRYSFTKSSEGYLLNLK